MTVATEHYVEAAVTRRVGSDAAGDSEKGAFDIGSDLTGVREVGDGALAAMLAQHYIAAVADRTETPTGERFRIVVDTCDQCAHAASPQSEVSDTVVAEAACDAEVIDVRPGPTQGHITRTIAPVLRVILLHNAKWKCEVEGCCNRLWLDVHHLRQRADGGGNKAENLVILCSAHHRAVHLGGLALDRDPRGLIVVTHRASPERHERRRGEPGASASAAGS